MTAFWILQAVGWEAASLPPSQLPLKTSENRVILSDSEESYTFSGQHYLKIKILYLNRNYPNLAEPNIGYHNHF